MADESLDPDWVADGWADASEDEQDESIFDDAAVLDAERRFFETWEAGGLFLFDEVEEARLKGDSVTVEVDPSPKVIGYESAKNGEQLRIVYDDGFVVSIVWHGYAYAGPDTVEIALIGPNGTIEDPAPWVPVEEIPKYLR